MVVFSVAPSARAQEDARARDWRGTVRVAKWVLAGATLALGVYAFAEHDAAERVHRRLRERCDAAPAQCRVADGRYTDAESEALHRRAVRHDRRARTGIVAGQITLLGGVALFLYDLRDDRGPDNIPYPSPRRTTFPEGAVLVGARIPF
ncbi:MAG: hypothetical protein ACT4PJ_10200 [Gemmatimonadaceae bacterium]